MKKICKNCKYWKPFSKSHFGECLNPHFVHCSEGDKMRKDLLMYWGVERYSASFSTIFRTGDQFECKFFKPKKRTKKMKGHLAIKTHVSSTKR